MYLHILSWLLHKKRKKTGSPETYRGILVYISNCVPPIVSAPDSKASLAIEGLSNMIAGPQATPINEDDDMFFARDSIVPQGAIQ